MLPQMYRIKTPTIAVLVAGGREVIVTIPQGDVIEVSRIELDTLRMLRSTWNGNHVRMFAVDLEERGELLEA